MRTGNWTLILLFDLDFASSMILYVGGHIDHSKVANVKVFWNNQIIPMEISMLIFIINNMLSFMKCILIFKQIIMSENLSHIFQRVII